MDQEIRFCTAPDGVRIAYATSGAGPALVKAANWLNHLQYDWESPIWRHVFRELSRDHLLVRFDKRGNGMSDWEVEDISFDACVRDLETVVDAAGLDRFALLGISQGRPQRCLVAGSASIRDGDGDASVHGRWPGALRGRPSGRTAVPAVGDAGEAHGDRPAVPSDVLAAAQSTRCPSVVSNVSAPGDRCCDGRGERSDSQCGAGEAASSATMSSAASVRTFGQTTPHPERVPTPGEEERVALMMSGVAREVVDYLLFIDEATLAPRAADVSPVFMMALLSAA